MRHTFKIEIPKPCHEDWDKIKPDGNARFCNSCTKNVVDFSSMNKTEIQEYFIRNQGKKVCGMFSNEQLDAIVIAVPKQLLFSQVQFHKMFLLALFVTMGTTLFSCSDTNGEKRSIDGIEVTDSIVETRTMGIPLPPKVDSMVVSVESLKNCAQTPRTKGEVILQPTLSTVTVYKDSITMSGGK